MTSPSPLLYDSYYHIYNRGNNRENIFIEERNYAYFLKLYAKHIEPVAETFAFCLLRNHFHLSVRIKSEDEIFNDQDGLTANQKPAKQDSLEKAHYPSKKFSDFFNAYTKAINKAYNRTGSLFQHPFGRVQVTSDRQFWNLIAYIHQNPQKHKFVNDFRDWKYSSYGILVSEKPTLLKRDTVLDWFGSRQTYLELHQTWVTDAESKLFAKDDFD